MRNFLQWQPPLTLSILFIFYIFSHFSRFSAGKADIERTPFELYPSIRGPRDTLADMLATLDNVGSLKPRNQIGSKNAKRKPGVIPANQ
ncbi:hypothetical protein [Sphingomonas melonis]|uniref:hypothetical protein n=1 Tax=Sphingomonas melonis TaxID=152682 RepID=UPI0035C7D187